MNDEWLLQALRLETDRAVIGEFVQHRAGVRPVPLNPHPAEQANPHRPLREAS